jgi:phage shock protein E
MKKFITPLIVLVIIIIGGVFIGTIKSEDPHFYDITVNQINKNITKGSILVDVRTPEEYLEKHAENSVNIPLDKIRNGENPNITKKKIVYVYCRSGVRAAEAKAILEQRGFTHVLSITSLDKWMSMGGKTSDSS